MEKIDLEYRGIFEHFKGIGGDLTRIVRFDADGYPYIYAYREGEGVRYPYPIFVRFDRRRTPDWRYFNCVSLSFDRDFKDEGVECFIDELLSGFCVKNNNGELEGFSTLIDLDGDCATDDKPIPKPDTVDWEQRRWELASTLFMRCYGSASIEMADAFIEEYKKSLNKEE